MKAGVNEGISDCYICFPKQRDGCPKIVNLGSSKTDLFYERKKYGFKKRWRNEACGKNDGQYFPDSVVNLTFLFLIKPFSL